MIACGIFVLGVVFSLFVTLRWIGQPLLDQHNFRQTQTAISTYWLTQGASWSHWLNYETPIFGSPWQIPLELPLYQWLVAGGHFLTGLPLDPLGRGINALFFYCLLWPLGMLLRDYGIDRRGFFLTGGLLLLSPLYVYWSRTFLIESTALLLSLLFLAWLRRYLVRQQPWYAVWLTVAGVLAVLTKVTTFAGCALAGVLMLLAHLIRQRGWEEPKRSVRIYLPVLVGFAICGVALELWMRHTAAITASSYFGHMLVPSNLSTWIYGTLAQRFSKELWRGAVWVRTIPEAVGSQFSLLICLFAVLRMKAELRKMVFVLLILFLLPFVVLTNLHLVHNYYQYANSLFLVLAVAICIWHLGQGRSTLTFIIACAMVVVGDFYIFRWRYLPSAREDFSQEPVLRLAADLQQSTDPNSILVIEGCEWNPRLAYYSRRRAIYIPSWVKRNELESFLRNPARLTDGRRISAVVDFTSGFELTDCELWREFINRLASENMVAKFAQYRSILLRGPEAWGNAIAADSLRSPAGGKSEWAKHPPKEWVAEQTRGAWASGRLEQVILDGNAVPASTAAVRAKRGSRLQAQGWVAIQAAKVGNPELILGLCGLTNWASRYMWASCGPAPTNAPGSIAQFEVNCSIPTDLPDDTYELLLFQKGGGQLIPCKLWLSLHLATRWSEQLPDGWSSHRAPDSLGGTERFMLDGQKVDQGCSKVMARPEAMLELWGWGADRVERKALPEMVLELTGTSNGLSRYVPVRRYWRADAAKALGSGMGESGFKVRCSLPEPLPPGVYRLNLLQRGANRTVELRVPQSLQIGP